MHNYKNYKPRNQ